MNSYCVAMVNSVIEISKKLVVVDDEGTGSKRGRRVYKPLYVLWGKNRDETFEVKIPSGKRITVEQKIELN